MLKVLIVDDNDDFRAYLKSVLFDAFPFAIIAEARDGAGAMRQFAFLKPDVVMLDLKLGGLSNGFDLTEKIRRQDHKTEIIVLTAHDVPEYREALQRLGANHFLGKGSCSVTDIQFAVRQRACELDNRYC